MRLKVSDFQADWTGTQSASSETQTRSDSLDLSCFSLGNQPRSLVSQKSSDWISLVELLTRSSERTLQWPLQEVQEEKQRPQHSMQISRQSADSQQASMMPQSMSHGSSQSPHSSEPQQQQKHESSEEQEPHVAQSSTMLHSIRNSQNRQARMQWTQQSDTHTEKWRYKILTLVNQCVMQNTCLIFNPVFTLAVKQKLEVFYLHRKLVIYGLIFFFFHKRVFFCFFWH